MKRSILEQIAPRLARAHRDRLAEIQRRRPCGREGYCCACWLAEAIRSGEVARVQHERTPWLFDRNDRRYAHDWPYRLVRFHSGFRMRVYDHQLEHEMETHE